MAHQLEVLELLQSLNQEQERTIVMVLHDLNQAARFADYIIALKDGQIVQSGNCETVITHDVLKKYSKLMRKLAKTLAQENRCASHTT